MNRLPRFTIRGLLVATAFLALALGWFISWRDDQRQLAILWNRSSAARDELQQRLRRAEHYADIDQEEQRSRGVLSAASVQGVDFRGAQIVAGDHAFQQSNFTGCDLRGSSLTGGAGAFRITRFDSANLQGAKLLGSFQLASFRRANLEDAVLTGSGGAFQGATLEGANLAGATISVSSATAFQGVNLSSANLQGADLSSIRLQNLETCHSDPPPTFNAATKLPEGFDPVAYGWELVE